jgi:hypothetical protein
MKLSFEAAVGFVMPVMFPTLATFLFGKFEAGKRGSRTPKPLMSNTQSEKTSLLISSICRKKLV